MEGNFRIVQESENRFIIEKEYDSYEYKVIRFLGIAIWTIRVPIKIWKQVDKKGKRPYSGLLIGVVPIELCEAWYLTLEEAKKALEDIKKYPNVVYEGLLDIASK
ncbi:hypothetical protein ATE47_04120 [Chryseobacterium sp. IHB B 17019]|uniref:hypothetical protein n=1 Tax=Chryseobacterium sp. IHB B 17019 TaxID=1721091 RepID=UPI00071F38C4|nr:hypothetical protein [Chryseobacterium sp. IHB B 17019]ALR29755.1 hypothetical protein ATE47_04120 [Chryseobacterium sp. IHB B 17019]